MRISINAYMDKEADGYEGSVSIDRDDVDDLYTLLSVLKDAVNAFGFTYVESLGAEKDDGEMMWSDF
jgi:hypothetical protein